MLELGKNEFILWERSANLKAKYFKLAGTLYITNKRIAFKPFLKKNLINIKLEDIENVELTKGIIKRIKINAKGKEYSFFTKGAKNVIQLIKNLLKNRSCQKIQ